MEIWTIAELERHTGLRRSTIYYYQREGLLPPVRRRGGRRAAYGATHLEAIREVQRLVQAGLTMREIKSEINRRGLASEVAGPDLVAEQTRATRTRLVAVATRHFAVGGFRETRLIDILAEAGIAANTFYGYFSGKTALFVDVVESLIVGSIRTAEPEIKSEPDLAKRHLLRASGFLSLRDISPGMLAFIRSEYLSSEDATRQVFIQIYRELASHIVEDLAVLRHRSSCPPLAPDEMMAFALHGGAETAAMRLSWDPDYTVRDYLWTNLELFLSVQAAYLGFCDLQGERQRYAPFIDDLVTNPRFVFRVEE
jgi:DNA-binding transcriptional MerR regulator